MAAPTYQTIKDNALTALDSLASGEVQSYSIGGRTYTGQDLDKLQSLVDWADKKLSAAAGGTRNYVEFPRRAI